MKTFCTQILEPQLHRKLRPLVVIAALTGLMLGSVGAATPGTDSAGVGLSPVLFGSIEPIVTESGFITVSQDAMGTSSSSGSIHVDKPVGASVRKAYLMSASTGFTSYRIPSGGVTINGSPITWDIETPSSISSYNYWADVTSIVKPIVDAFPAGINTLTIGEQSSSSIDGEVLAVIFDDPGKTSVSTVVLLFGAQKVGGDTFKITLSDPINLSQPDLVLNMSLGISFGHQTVGYGDQFSYVDVNGQRLTSSAGGEDDGQLANGALITVGGIGDSNANPPPNASPATLGDRTDDELYNLIPFVQDGDTSITVFTQNPSTDDNIFFSALVLSGGAVVNEGILLSPVYKANPVGTQHTVTAAVQDNNGNPVVGRQVTFLVESGPNAGVTGTAVTAANGSASFTYMGNIQGVDVIVASMNSSAGQIIYSNEVLKQWVNPPVITRTLAGNRGYYQLTASSGSYGNASLAVYVRDSVSGFVAGPFPSGTIVRMVRGVPGTGPGQGTASVTIRVAGTGLAYAVDPLGSESAKVTCSP